MTGAHAPSSSPVSFSLQDMHVPVQGPVQQRPPRQSLPPQSSALVHCRAQIDDGLQKPLMHWWSAEQGSASAFAQQALAPLHVA
jgi:hypothetical protein